MKTLQLQRIAGKSCLVVNVRSEKKFLYRLCLPRRVTPSIEYLMYTCDQAFCDHKYSVLWPKTKGGWTVPLQWKYIIQIVTWNIVFHGSLFTFKLIPSNLGHQHKMTLQLPHTFRPHKVIISILKFCPTGWSWRGSVVKVCRRRRACHKSWIC